MNTIEDTIGVEKVNEAFIKVHADRSMLQELSEYFSFFVKDYKYMPKYKSGMWDGRLRLLNLQTNKLYSGLFSDILKFSKARQYDVVTDDALKEDYTPHTLNIKSFIEKLKLPFIPHDYQEEAFNQILNLKKILILSPTSSGKSLIAYLSVSYAIARGMKVLMVVPTTTLVDQMYDDFASYGSRFQDGTHKIYGGADKSNNADFIITTWQSAFKLDKTWFDPFGMVIVDECHLATANSIKGIMEKCTNTLYRIGMTGTLEDTKTSKFVLRGLFGKIFETIKTKELTEREITAKLDIVCLMLKYPKDLCKQLSGLVYEDEVKYIIEHEKRTKLIVNLATSKSKNTLVLFRFAKHGKKIFDDILAKETGKNIFYIDQTTKTDERTRIKKFMEVNSDCILVASYGTFATGISIKNLHFLIFAFAYKAKIKTRQAIGRLLRRSTTNNVVLYDICDNMSYKSKTNTLYTHFTDRLAEYEKEGFDYTIRELQL